MNSGGKNCRFGPSFPAKFADLQTAWSLQAAS